MKHISAASCSPPNYCRYSRSTLFQFIISEFLLAHRHVERLNALIAQPEGIIALKIALADLLSPSMDQPYRHWRDGSTLSSHCGQGSFGKLVYYCALWEGSEGNPDGQALKRKTHKAWLLCLELQGLVAHCQGDGDITSSVRDWRSFQAVVIRLNGLMVHLMQVLAELLFYFSRDENVLFFLLRYREELDALYGSGFMGRWLQRSFFGLDKAVKFLHSRYAKRGFVKLLPVITAKIAAAKASL